MRFFHSFPRENLFLLGFESRFIFSCILVSALSPGFLGVGSKVVVPFEDQDIWTSIPFHSPPPPTPQQGGTEDLESVELDPVDTGLEDDDPFQHSTAHNDNDYLDDGVTFITDEEVLYDDHTPSSSAFPNTNAYLQRGRENVVGGHAVEKCPPLPDASASVVSLGLCEMRVCHRDEECSRDGSFVCCFNGCIHSCLPRVTPPLVFDWLEETELKTSSSNDSSQDFNSGSKNLRNLMDSSVSPDEIALPGGCSINSQQYEDLILFRKFEHVKSCTCSKGEVFCEVNTSVTPPTVADDV